MTQDKPLLRYNTFAELQQEICDIVNTAPELSACGVTFYPENALDIDYQITNSLKKQGIAAVVMTPDARYIGYEDRGCVYQLDNLTLMISEFPAVNRASNRKSVATGLDIANFCAEVLAGPNAVVGFGKLNVKNIEQGEDSGLLVTKVTFQTVLSNGAIPPYIWVEYVTHEELSAAIDDLSATVDSRLSNTQSRWGNITGDLSDQTDLKLTLDGLSDAIDINTSNINEISVGLEEVQNELATTSALLSNAIDGLSNAIDNTNEAVEALAESKADKTELSEYARKANTSIDYNSTTKKITLDADGHQTQIDATAFIKDGMVDNARYDAESKMIVITFNTDAGKEPISVDVAALFNEYTAGTGLILDNAEFSVDTTVVAQKSDLEPYALSIDVDKRLEDKADLTAIEKLEEKDEALSAEISSVVTVTGISGDIYHNLSVVHITQDEYYELLVLSALQPNCLYVLDREDYINAFGQQIKNLSGPTVSSDAATKQYVDDAISSVHFDPSVLSAYALSADVDSRLTAKADLTSIGNGTLTIKQGTTTLGTFTANQNTGTTVTIPAQQAPSWGQITGNLTAQTDLKNALDAKADSTDLEPYALSADVDSRLTAKADLTAIGDATVTINQDGVQKAQFTLNQKNNVTVNLEKGDEAAWGNITGEISAQTDLKQELDNRYTVIATWSE